MRPFLYPRTFEVCVLRTDFPRPLAELRATPFEPPGPAPEAVWRAVTDELARFGRRRSHQRRPGGERVGKAVRAGRLRPVDPVVDAAIATASAHGLPVTIVDRDRLRGPLRFATTAHGTRMVVDARGTTVDAGKLPSLDDADGPQATPVAVADAARPTPATRTTLSVVWGSRALGDVLAAARRDHYARLVALGGTCTEVFLPGSATDPVGLALLARILDSPDDDDARRAFAEWLDAQGGACERRRARLIRESLAGRTDYDLVAEVARDADLTTYPLRWARGFADELVVSQDDFAPLLPRLAEEPVRTVSTSVPLHAPLPATVRELSLTGPAVSAIVHAAPHRLRKLHIRGSPSDRNWDWMTDLPSVEWFAMDVSADVPWQLPTAAAWPHLRTLRLLGGRFTPASAAAAPTARLTALDLNDNGLDDATLAAMPRADALEALWLSRNAVTTLAPFDGLRLRQLHLWKLPLAAIELDRILAMTSIEVLHVSDCPAVAEPLRRAIDDGALPALRKLYGLWSWRRTLAHGGRPPGAEG